MSSQDKEIIENAMEYFSSLINNSEDWKKLYSELSRETLCCQETDNVLLLKIKKILISRSLMHLWTRENIFKIMALVKDEILNSLSIRSFIDRE